MGLIGNRFRNSTGCHLAVGDLPAYSVPRTYTSWSYTRTQDFATTVLAGLSFPVGLTPGPAWFAPQTGGEMVLRSDSSGDLAADLIPSRPMSIDMTGAGDLEAIGALAIAMAIALTGSGALTATVQGRLNASVDMTGSGDLEADLAGFGNMLVDMLGEGSLEATIAAYGNMAVDIVVTGTGLSTANVGQAVWSALASANNDTGTMGEKLNDAGSASNPWTEVIDSGYTAAEVMRLIASALAGKVSGGGGSTITFRDLADGKDRITATVDTFGNRTAVVTDVT